MLLETNQNLNDQELVRKKILYVEDDISSQRLVDHLLQKKYDVEMADRGIDALRMAKQTDYDLILMDIKLGKGITGIEVTRELRKIPRYKKVPILAVTAYAMPGDDEYIKAEGCNDYVSKPINFAEFKQKVDQLLFYDKELAS